MKILDELEEALERQFSMHGDKMSGQTAKIQRNRIHHAFEESIVEVEACHMPAIELLPDPNDSHVIGAAIACGASLIVTENLKHFPASVIEPHGLEAKSADAFVADTIDLRTGASIKALAKMKQRFNKPTLDAEQLLLLYESRGFYETADILRPYIDQL